MDWSILHALNGFLVHHDAVEDPYADYVRFSELLFLGLLAWIFIASRGYARRAARRGAVAAGLSAGLSLLLASQIANLVGRPRPFVDEPSTVHLLVAHAADPGFPSHHAPAALALAAAVPLPPPPGRPPPPPWRSCSAAAAGACSRWRWRSRWRSAGSRSACTSRPTCSRARRSGARRRCSSTCRRCAARSTGWRTGRAACGTARRARCSAPRDRNEVLGLDVERAVSGEVARLEELAQVRTASGPLAGLLESRLGADRRPVALLPEQHEVLEGVEHPRVRAPLEGELDSVRREEGAHVRLIAPLRRRRRPRRRRGHVLREDAEHAPYQALGRPVDEADGTARPAHAHELVRHELVAGSELRADDGEHAIERLGAERQRLGVALDPVD